MPHSPFSSFTADAAPAFAAIGKTLASLGAKVGGKGLSASMKAGGSAFAKSAGKSGGLFSRLFSTSASKGMTRAGSSIISRPAEQVVKQGMSVGDKIAIAGMGVTGLATVASSAPIIYQMNQQKNFQKANLAANMAMSHRNEGMAAAQVAAQEVLRGRSLNEGISIILASSRVGEDKLKWVKTKEGKMPELSERAIRLRAALPVGYQAGFDDLWKKRQIEWSKLSKKEKEAIIKEDKELMTQQVSMMRSAIAQTAQAKKMEQQQAEMMKRQQEAMAAAAARQPPPMMMTQPMPMSQPMMMMPQQGMMPQQAFPAGFSPQQPMMIPQQGMMPQQPMMMPQQSMMMPQPGMVMPNQMQQAMPVSSPSIPTAAPVTATTAAAKRTISDSDWQRMMRAATT